MIKKFVSLIAVPVIAATLVGCSDDRREVVYVEKAPVERTVVHVPAERTVVHVQPSYTPYMPYTPLVFAPLVFGPALSFDDGYEKRRLNNQLTAKDREIQKLREQKRAAYRKANNEKRKANRAKYEKNKAEYDKKQMAKQLTKRNSTKSSVNLSKAKPVQRNVSPVQRKVNPMLSKKAFKQSYSKPAPRKAKSSSRSRSRRR